MGAELGVVTSGADTTVRGVLGGGAADTSSQDDVLRGAYVGDTRDDGQRPPPPVMVAGADPPGTAVAPLSDHGLTYLELKAGVESGSAVSVLAAEGPVHPFGAAPRHLSAAGNGAEAIRSAASEFGIDPPAQRAAVVVDEFDPDSGTWNHIGLGPVSVRAGGGRCG